MGTTTSSIKLALWRRQRRRRQARREARELTQKTILPRPGGNPATFAQTYYEAEQATDRPLMGVPALKHVPFNTHRTGSIAYALLYNYWLPNATERK